MTDINERARALRAAIDTYDNGIPERSASAELHAAGPVIEAAEALLDALIDSTTTNKENI